MKVKTFRGSSTRDVLDQVRTELGEEAVILSNRSYSEQGRQVCEVMAGVENDQELEQAPSKAEDSSWPGWEAWHQEWSRVKSRIFSLFRPQIDLERLSPRQRLAMEYLEQEGVSEEVLLLLWQRLQREPQASILSLLNRLVHVRPWGFEHWPQKCHALSGPHGVGKTSTVLRLALDARQKQPDCRICLVNADLHQGKGRLFLKHYAELSDFGYLEARGYEDWKEVARSCRDYDRVFLDLPGLGRGRDLQSWWSETGLQSLGDVSQHLVLSPGYSSLQLQDFVRKYSSPQLAGLIWTKVDEACMFGDLVTVGQETGLPISLFTCGPALKNHMFPAGEKRLWRLVFKHKLPLEEQET
ncbi:MAG: flagellar biosynthesis protein FlhF [Desulfohalobiaceae bacterium]